MAYPVRYSSRSYNEYVSILNYANGFIREVIKGWYISTRPNELKSETHAGVRAVLGHFIFVFIHPYMDGNGRIGRFLFNVMLASGGYSWTIIPVAKRDTYLSALEKASVHGDITNFTQFLGGLVQKSSEGN